MPEVFEEEMEEESVCFNCHRTQHNYLTEKFQSGDLNSVYVMSFCHHSLEEIRRQRKFKTFESNEGDDEHGEITLCKECSNHLTKEDKETYNNVSNVWPGFIWCLLKNLNVQEDYGKKVWTFIPELWRYWWIKECKRLIPLFEDVSIRKPREIFVDRTTEIHE